MRLFKLLFPVKITDIRSFYFGSTENPMEMNAGYHYSLRLEKGGTYTAEYKPSGLPDKQALKKSVDKAFADKLAQMLRDRKISRRNGFDKHDKRVMDGGGFSLDVYFTNGRELRAHGYMRYPEGYGSFWGN